MSKEACIAPFVRRVQRDLEGGQSLPEVLAQIKGYQKSMAKLVTKINPEARVFHFLALTTPTLAWLALWEYGRIRAGLPLPNSLQLLKLIPVASLTDREASIYDPGGLKQPDGRICRGYPDGHMEVVDPRTGKTWYEYDKGTIKSDHQLSPEDLQRVRGFAMKNLWGK